MSSNTKAIAKLKKKYSKWPWETGLTGFKNWLLQKLPAFFILFFLRNILVESDYKLKRESTKFFKYSNTAYGANKRRSCDRLLVIAFALIDRHFDVSYVVLMRNAVQSTLNKSRRRSELSENILEATKRLEISTLDATGWYQLSRGLFSVGYFRAAWVARENSLDLSISEGTTLGSSVTAVSRAIEAHLERLELNSVRKVLSENIVLGPKKLDSYRESLGLLEPNFASNSGGAIGKDGVAEKFFYVLVNGKRVVLVGPGHPRGEYGDEIDSADTVARVKFVGTENLPAQKFHGSRCNIAYQPALDVLAKYVNLGVNIDYYEKIDLFVSGNELSKFGTKPVLNIETSIPMYRTTAVSGIILLFHLIRAAPRKLTVYGFDFRAARKQYSNEARDFYKINSPLIGGPYPGFDSEDLSEYIIAYDFCEHDFVSNFCFAQNLYKAGLFDIEPYGKSILELTPYQYVERLEEMLGDW